MYFISQLNTAQLKIDAVICVHYLSGIALMTIT